MIYATLLAPILLSYSLQTPRGPVVDHTGKPLTPTDANIKMADGGDPLLLRAARGETVERPPVWMMRQAGRHMKVYRDLCKKYPTFRQRSEIAEVATEISLQPWNAYQTDGVILFSDILTPLPGMGVDFDILEKAGPKMTPIRSAGRRRRDAPDRPRRRVPLCPPGARRAAPRGRRQGDGARLHRRAVHDGHLLRRGRHVVVVPRDQEDGVRRRRAMLLRFRSRFRRAQFGRNSRRNFAR